MLIAESREGVNMETNPDAPAEPEEPEEAEGEEMEEGGTAEPAAE
jgi:hypothetical protein